ncbi:MAG: cell division protein SepF [Bacilli bacterium]|nr:cell division protein SepF [Bacilli bacterium]
MALDKFKKFFNGEEEVVNQTTEDEYYEDAQDALKNVVGNGNKMILLEPRAYSESQQIADHLKKRNSVVVNLKRVTPDQGKRIVDFLSGTVYAIGGDLQKLGTGIFLCTPKNINVEGKITEEAEKEEKEEKPKKKQEKDFDFEW